MADGKKEIALKEIIHHIREPVNNVTNIFMVVK